MNKRQSRLAAIINILQHNSVGSQEELLRLLQERKCNVTQATLSRDLKTLRTSKVATEMGGYRYVIASGTAPDNSTPPTIDNGRNSTILSVARTGSLVVIKTRNGYAPGLAHDIDSMENPHILGTVAGVDTIFIATSQSSSARDVYLALSLVIPADVMNNSRHSFFQP